MRLRVWDRIFSALMGILIVLAGVGVLLFLFGVVPGEWVQKAKDGLTGLQGWKLWVGAAVCVLVILLGLRGVAVLFRRRREKGFVKQHMEYGDMSISMKAIENMIRRCMEDYDDVKISAIFIHRVREGIDVEMKVVMKSGTNIPLTVNALQKQVKQYITSCSGIDVREVRVRVETELPKHLPAPEAAKTAPAEQPAEEETKQGKGLLWHHEEEPKTYADEKPEAAAEAPVTAEPAAEEPVVASEPVIELPAEEPVQAEAAEVIEETTEEVTEETTEEAIEEATEAAQELPAEEIMTEEAEPAENEETAEPQEEAHE